MPRRSRFFGQSLQEFTSAARLTGSCSRRRRDTPRRLVRPCRGAFRLKVSRFRRDTGRRVNGWLGALGGANRSHGDVHYQGNMIAVPDPVFVCAHGHLPQEGGPAVRYKAVVDVLREAILRTIPPEQYRLRLGALFDRAKVVIGAGKPHPLQRRDRLRMLCRLLRPIPSQIVVEVPGDNART